MTDRTRNLAGDENMVPLAKLTPDAVTEMFDDFVRDGWMRPEDRMEQIAITYRAQLDVYWRMILDIRGEGR